NKRRRRGRTNRTSHSPSSPLPGPLARTCPKEDCQRKCRRPKIPSHRMRDAAILYFNGEKYAAMLLFGLGILACIVATSIFRRPRLRGAALPLVLVGLVELGVGASVWNRSDDQLSSVLARLERAPTALTEAELLRMGRVMKGFTIYEFTEAGVFGL